MRTNVERQSPGACAGAGSDLCRSLEGRQRQEYRWRRCLALEGLKADLAKNPATKWMRGNRFFTHPMVRLIGRSRSLGALITATPGPASQAESGQYSDDDDLLQDDAADRPLENSPNPVA